MLGKDNLIVLKLTAQGQITGGGSEADVVGPHTQLNSKARLVGVRIGGQAVSSGGTAAIQVYAGANKTSGTAVLSSTVSLTPTTLKGEGTITDGGKRYSAGQEFALSENTTATKTIDGLYADLFFRTYGPT